jgi:hypothetical protein
MAKQQNQAILITLMLFVLLTAVFGIGTIGFWVRANTFLAERDQMQQDLNQARTHLRSAEQDNQQLKRLIGFAPDATQQVIDDQYVRDTAVFGVGLDENQRSYREFCQLLFNTVQEKTAQVRNYQDGERKLLADLEAARQQAESIKQEADRTIAQAQRDLLETRERLNQVAAADDQQRRDLLRQLDEQRRNLARAEEDFRKQVSDKDLELRNVNIHLDRAKRQLDDQNTQSFQVPDGAVTWVNQKTRTAWIDLGRDDGLRPNITFRVYARGANNLEGTTSKGSIEVTSVRNGHTAEARILEDDYRNPIMPGDLIASPVWNPGSPLHFALVGKMDITGDGIDNRTLVRNLIRQTGGVIDAEDSADGQVVGQISIHTRYLVEGDQPTVNDRTPEGGRGSQIEAYTELSREADRLGIERISVHKLIDAMGMGTRVRRSSETRMLNAGQQDAPPAPVAGENSEATPGRRESW